jgi:hypothetical protein
VRTPSTPPVAVSDTHLRWPWWVARSRRSRDSDGGGPSGSNPSENPGLIDKKCRRLIKPPFSQKIISINQALLSKFGCKINW